MIGPLELDGQPLQVPLASIYARDKAPCKILIEYIIVAENVGPVIGLIVLAKMILLPVWYWTNPQYRGSRICPLKESNVWLICFGCSGALPPCPLGDMLGAAQCLQVYLTLFKDDLYCC